MSSEWIPKGFKKFSNLVGSSSEVVVRPLDSKKDSFDRRTSSAAGGEEPEPEMISPRQCVDVEKRLWKAVRGGSLHDVQEALDGGARLNYKEPSLDDMELGLIYPESLTVDYKARRLYCQPLHVAVFRLMVGKPNIRHSKTDVLHIKSQLSHAEWSSLQRSNHSRRADGDFRQEMLESTRIVELLLEKKAEVSAMAWTAGQAMEDRNVLTRRGLQAIHLAAGVGNVGALEALLKAGADLNAQAIIDNNGDRKPYYLPIHDAAWYNRVDCVETLLTWRASVLATNSGMDTAIHLAAKLGHVKLIESFVCLENRHRREISLRGALTPTASEKTARNIEDGARVMAIRNSQGQTPLDCAVDGQLFPERYLHLLTHSMDDSAKVDAFLKVAHACPSAASALLRGRQRRITDDDDSDQDENTEQATMEIGGLDSAWRQCLLKGAVEKKITAQDLTMLLLDAPQAAADLLDALTDVPEVSNIQHHPLPMRARMPRCAAPCPIAVAYEKDLRWEFDASAMDSRRKERFGGRPWHKTLAPCYNDEDKRKGKEVQIRVLKLSGIVNLEVLHCLSHMQNTRIFSKLVVHALLEFAFLEFRPFFVMDLLHEAAAIIALTCWIYGVSEEHRFLFMVLWCTVASQALSELVMMVLTECRRWRRLRVHDGGFGSYLVGTLARLALSLGTLTLSFVSAGKLDTEGYAMGLGVTSLFHWLRLLVELRAFPWTGQKILPIMKSVQPIAGMLVILFFLMSAFWHAFWAVDRSNGDDTAFFQVALLLLTGEGYLDSDQLQGMDDSRRLFMITLTLVAVFIFLACAMNVFIAVLGDCYDREQERMIVTFLRTRAEICTTLYLRPCFRCPQAVAAAVVVLLFSVCIGVLVACHAENVSPWLLVVLLTCLIIAIHGFQRGRCSVDWKTRHLWLCNELQVDEELYMADEGENDLVEANGRILRIKKCIFEQCGSVSEQCASLRRAVHKQRAAFLDDSMDKEVRAADERNQLQKQIEEMQSQVNDLHSGMKDMRTDMYNMGLQLSRIADVLDRAQGRREHRRSQTQSMMGPVLQDNMEVRAVFTEATEYLDVQPCATEVSEERPETV
eukprot:TRINITY_DN41075_c0_g1_i1.p1 TRINITY_DN41075_c0_g1~~TRINITY_DN41075_c0_g1_i1.p1  ORF type:complete len:1083 (+),score=202.33 TRINITY_DN41075_c0_g1_i1:140-3388(+)